MGESERTQLGAAASARAAELIADFMRRHDTWRKQADDLARQREEVRVAAEREAASLLTKARADIGRTLVETRRELQALAAQLRAVSEPLTAVGVQAEAPPSGLTRPAATLNAEWAATSESVVQARRNLQRVLAEAQPEIEELTALTRSFGPSARAPEPANSSSLQTSNFNLQNSDVSNDLFPRKEETAKAAPRPTMIFAGQRTTGSGHTKRLVTVLALIGAAVVATVTGWHLVVPSGGGERQTPVAVAPRITSKPQATAAPALRPAAIAPPPTLGPAPVQASAPARIPSSLTRGTPSGGVSTAGADTAKGRPGPPTEDARADILILSQRWLDGYYRRDQNSMAYVAVPDASIIDDREVNERLTAGLTQVGRTFDQMHFEQRGDTAALTARMTELGDIRGYTTRVVSFVSERWRRQNDRWRLDGMLILREAK